MANLTQLQRDQIANAASMLHLLLVTGKPLSDGGKRDAKRFIENLMRIWEDSSCVDRRDTWFAEWQLVLPKDAREEWPGGQVHDAPPSPSTAAPVAEVAAALEQQRALKIVADVRRLRTENEMPSYFDAGYDLACEEIDHRLRTEEWSLGDVPAPLPGANGETNK